MYFSIGFAYTAIGILTANGVFRVSRAESRNCGGMGAAMAIVLFWPFYWLVGLMAGGSK